MIRVALADDHPLLLKIVRQELGCAPDICVAWETSDLRTLIGTVRQTPPDVLVLDLAFAGQAFEPVSVVRDLRAQFPHMAILILTANDEPTWVEAMMRAGAHGYVMKSDDFSLRLTEGIRAVAGGRTFLSPSAAKALTNARQKYTLTERERAILRLAAQGHANPEIATTLGLAHGTVRNHLSNIYAKLEVENREAAVRAAQDLRELPQPGASLRHEFRTPLYTLIGLARLLQGRLVRQGQLGGSDADLLDQIVIEAERLNNLIEDWTP